MKITPIKTPKIIPGKSQDFFKILDRYLPSFKEGSILAITSKVIAICEGRIVKIGKINKDELIKKEAEYYLPRNQSKYGFSLTIKNNLLIPSSGIDESNGAGFYVLWPKNPQKTANEVRAYLVKRFLLKKVGVIITDSKTTPLRWGVTGSALTHSGFLALNDYIGKLDLFDRKLRVTKVNVMDAMAAAAVLVMGEGNEQTPMAKIEDLPFVKFVSRNPTKKELKDLHIEIADDLYAPLLQSVNWQKGGAPLTNNRSQPVRRTRRLDIKTPVVNTL